MADERERKTKLNWKHQIGSWWEKKKEANERWKQTQIKNFLIALQTQVKRKVKNNNNERVLKAILILFGV